MNNKDEQIQEIEMTMEAAKEQVAFAEALQKLHANPEFRKTILEGYFRDEPARLVGLLADPNMADDRSQAHLQASLRAVSELRQFFAMKFHFGELAARAIEEGQQAMYEVENDLDPGEEA